MSALHRLYELMQLKVQYLETAGNHAACLPSFLSTSCLQKNSCGEIEYNFGPDAHFATINDLPDQTLVKKPKKVSKRQLDSTPQRGTRRKRPLTSTPRRERKIATPIPK